jgi:hypothetical protein
MLFSAAFWSAARASHEFVFAGIGIRHYNLDENHYCDNRQIEVVQSELLRRL